MANAVVQGTNTSNDTTSPATVSLPASIAATELLMFSFAIDGSASVTTPAGWTLADSELDASGVGLYLFTKQATGSEGASVDVTFTGGTFDSAHASYRVSTNVYTVQTNTAQDSTNDATVNPPSLTTSGSDDYLWVAIGSIKSNSTASSYPTNYTGSNITASGTAGPGIAMATRQLTATTEDPSTFTFGTAGRDTSMTVAITPPTAVSGNSALLLGAGSIFQTGISYGASGTSALLLRAGSLLTASLQKLSPTRWTNEVKPSTTWTNETKL